MAGQIFLRGLGEMTQGQIFAKRNEVIAQKKTLIDNGGSQDSPEWRALNQQHRDLSEAEGILFSKAGAALQIEARGGRNINFVDSEWPDGSKVANVDELVSFELDGQTVYAIIESKGGSAGMGKRLATDGKYAEQGSQQYHNTLVADMRDKYDRMILVQGQSSDYYNKLADMKTVIDVLRTQNVEFHLFAQPLTDIHGTPSQMKYSRYQDLTSPGG